jgi:hypothetical protein
MSLNFEDDADPVEEHVIEAELMLDGYDGALIDSWATADLCRFHELIDIELQQRVPV